MSYQVTYELNISWHLDHKIHDNTMQDIKLQKAKTIQSETCKLTTSNNNVYILKKLPRFTNKHPPPCNEQHLFLYGIKRQIK